MSGGRCTGTTHSRSRTGGSRCSTECWTRGADRCTRRGCSDDDGSPSTGDGIVGFSAGVVLIPVSFDPLEEFEVILETTFYETIDGNGFVDIMGCEGLLEDFKILNIFIFIFRVELIEIRLDPWTDELPLVFGEGRRLDSC